MALSKCISSRYPGDIAATVREIDAEIGRDNPEMFFVTVLAGILDLRTGHLDYCNAGHDAPYVLAPGRSRIRLAEGGGPPLCTVAGFQYQADGYDLSHGETLCVVTDGVTEAMNARQELFGHERLADVLALHGDDPSPVRVGNAIRDAVSVFAGGAEPADDVTILALRWKALAA